MSLIEINNLTFSYENSSNDVFINASFSIDTDWKLGFTGRNGRGKTTLLKLLIGEYEYRGSIKASVEFDYFPYKITDISQNTLEIIKKSIANFSGMEREMERLLDDPTEDNLIAYGEISETYESHDGYVIDELIKKEISKLSVDENVLYRPFETLSNGERTKVLLAALFLKKNNFLLIDEPTNHLDINGREIVAKYLNSKKSFILVSHDKSFLDSVVDHMLVINKNNIEVQRGNYSSFNENKKRQDEFEIAQNKKLEKEIDKLAQAAKRTAEWSDKVESEKIGFSSGKHEKSMSLRSYLGEKSRKMMKRSKVFEQRQEREIEEKTKLLKNLEYENTLSVKPLEFKGKFLVEAVDFSINYGAGELFSPKSFSISKGERVWLKGQNGSGKSSILKLICGEDIPHSGALYTASRLKLSYVSQDTSMLCGTLDDFAEQNEIDLSLFKTILIKLDFKRSQFDSRIEDFSEGQKKKTLLAASLASQAHIYIWDEPLNFIDILSREQIEELILNCEPTMLFVEHDVSFSEAIATKIIEL